MAWFFGESFDLYSQPSDMALGHWDASSTISGIASAYFVVGRFPESQALKGSSGSAQKTSGSNDAVHHISVAFMQSGTLSGTSQGSCIQLQDVGTTQCTLYFRTDGAMVLTRGAYNGTVVATYAGAYPGGSVWAQYEIEIVISSTVGRMRVRVNGNTTEDYDSGATLNTQFGSNPYANRLTFNNPVSVSSQTIDDFLWRSDSTAPPWLGDIRCYTRRPASDVQAQWTPAGTRTQSYSGGSGYTGVANRAFYESFTPTINGTLASATLSLVSAYPGNIKCAVFADNAGSPGAVFATATNIAIAPTVSFVFTFPAGVTISANQKVWLSFCLDTGTGSSFAVGTTGSAHWFGTTPYASFPAANPTGLSASGALTASLSITPAANSGYVSDVGQDAAASYISSATPGNMDLYNISAISGSPASVVAVVTRGIFQKTDAGSRQVALVLKSGATTSQGSNANPFTTWTNVERTDLVDPATNAAWTAIGVNSLQIGTVVTI